MVIHLLTRKRSHICQDGCDSNAINMEGGKEDNIVATRQKGIGDEIALLCETTW